MTKLVSEKNVKTLVRGLAAQVQYVTCKIIYQFAHAHPAIPEIHLRTATKQRHVSNKSFTQRNVVVVNNSIQINYLVSIAVAPIEHDPCSPSPCGPNANCRDGICTCIQEYHGDPYTGCRPECTLNDECPSNKACLRNKCIDPCPGSCGISAICNVYNHVPICTCPQGMTGNPFVFCRPYEGIIFCFVQS